MKALIAYYSRTGNTKKLAELINYALNGDIEEIIEDKDRSGIIGYILAGKDAILRRITKIQNINSNLSEYDIVIVGTPVWAGQVPPAVRTFLMGHSEKIRKIAFFITMGSNSDKSVIKELIKISQKEPVKTLALNSNDLKTKEISSLVHEFTENL